jgi:excisionase family DNA binding protein
LINRAKTLKNNYLTAPAAAERLHVSKQTIYLYIKHGFLTAYKPRGTRWLVSAEDVERMARGEVDVSGIYKGWRKR